MYKIENQISPFWSKPSRTKIVCSVRCDTDFHTLRELILGGMNVAKINSSYGSYKELSNLISRINDAATTTKRLCSIILETHGKHIWTGPHEIKKNLKQISSFENILKSDNDNNNINSNNDSNSETNLAKALGLKMLPQGIKQNMDFALRIFNGEFTGNEDKNDDTKESLKDSSSVVSDNDNESDNETITRTIEQDLPRNNDINGINGDNGNNSEFTDKISFTIQTHLDILSQTDDPKSAESSMQLKFPNDIMCVELKKGDTIRIITDKIIKGTSKQISIYCPGICRHLNIEQEIKIYPNIILIIKQIDQVNQSLNCDIKTGGTLGEYQRVEIQGLKKFDTVTQKDYDDLTFGITNGIDYVLISEVRRSMDIRDLKETMNVIYADNKNKKNVLRHHMMRKTATQSVNSSPQNMKNNNNSNDIIDEVPALSHITSDFEENQLFNIDDEGNNQYIRTKVLAKIENYKCLYQIDDIISESDGIVIDIGNLTKSLDSNKKHYIKKIKDTKRFYPEIRSRDEFDVDRHIERMINEMILICTKQAKVVIITDNISTRLLNFEEQYKQSLTDNKTNEEKTNFLKNKDFYLSKDDMTSISKKINYNIDGILCNCDLMQLQQIYSEINSNVITKGGPTIISHDNPHESIYGPQFSHFLIANICDYVRFCESKLNHSLKFATLLSQRFSTNAGFEFNDNELTDIKEDTINTDNNIPSFNNASMGNGVGYKRTKSLDSKIMSHSNSMSSVSSSEIITDDVSICSSTSSISSTLERKLDDVDNIYESMASSAVKISFDLNCKLIVVLTQSGRIAKLVSKYRPNCIILAITDSIKVAKHCMLMKSVFPILVLNMKGTDALIGRCLNIANKAKLVNNNDKVVVIAGQLSDILDEPCDFYIKLLKYEY